MLEVLKIVSSIVGITFLVIVELAMIGGVIQNFKLRKLSKLVKKNTQKKINNKDAMLDSLEKIKESIDDSGCLAKESYELESKRYEEEKEEDIPAI